MRSTDPFLKRDTTYDRIIVSIDHIGIKQRNIREEMKSHRIVCILYYDVFYN